MNSFHDGYIDIENNKNVSTVAGEVTNHLARVYSCLLATTAFACAGVIFYLYTFFPPLLSALAAIGLLCFLVMQPELTEQNNPNSLLGLSSSSVPMDPRKALPLLMAFGFFEGASIGGIVWVSLQIDPSIVLTAFLGTLVIFGCLSSSALLAKRKTYLYMGGFLSSALANLFMLAIVNIFLRLEFVSMVLLYGGLFVFCGYVLYDTQVIIEKVNMGSRDYVKHAAQLFIDLVGIFVRLLIILAKSQNKKR